MLDTLERWYGWGSSIAIETAGGVNKIKAGILHYMEDFSNIKGVGSKLNLSLASGNHCTSIVSLM